MDEKDAAYLRSIVPPPAKLGKGVNGERYHLGKQAEALDERLTLLKGVESQLKSLLARGTWLREKMYDDGLNDLARHLGRGTSGLSVTLKKVTNEIKTLKELLRQTYKELEEL